MAVVDATVIGRRLIISFPQGHIYAFEREKYEKFKKILRKRGFRRIGEYAYELVCEDPRKIIGDMKRYIGIIEKELIV